MKRYILVFAAAYLMLSVAIGLLSTWLDLRDGGTLNVAATVAAAFVAAHRFGRDHERTPTVEERRTFAWQALLCVWGMTLLLAVLAFVFWMPPGAARGMLRMLAANLPVAALAAGAIVVVSGVYWLVLRLSFGWYAGLLVRR